MTTRSTPGPRERLLDAAHELMYSQGVGVGVDALLKTANAARRSLYEHFGGKDGLIAEVLRRSAAQDETSYRTTMAAAGDDPRARLLAVFDELALIVKKDDFRGCRYLAADLALADPEHPGHAITREYRARVTGLFEDELTRLGHPHPGRAAGQLLLLVDGVLAAGATRPDSDPAGTGRELALGILAQAGSAD
jgi:AcrR family transcriptional regulator